jgi:NADH dehydrogenase FAD-containing subunit
MKQGVPSVVSEVTRKLKEKRIDVILNAQVKEIQSDKVVL